MTKLNPMIGYKLKKGFTLIELLVVIAIIGLISSVVLASLNVSRKKAHDSQIKSNLRQLKIALELYYSDNGSYPNTSFTWWAESPTYGSHTLSGANGWVPNLAPQYMGTLPRDQNSGKNRTSFDPGCNSNESHYFYISNGTDYKIDAYCIVEIPIQNNDGFYNPIAPGISATVYTPGAVNW